MAENAVPGKGMLAFGKKADSSYVPISLASDGSVNISGSITASLGAFNPLGKATRSVTTSTSNIALPTSDKGLVLINTGANDAYFKLGAGGVTAAVTDYLIKAGCILGLDATGFTTIAAITAAGSTSIDIWTGTGLISAAQAGGSGGGGNVNINQVGGASVALGQAAMAASFPVVLASDQSNVPGNLKQVNGAALALGQTTKSASLPVTLASDTGNIPVAVADRLEIAGSSSAAGVFSNFPQTDTSGYRSMALQITAIAAGSTEVVEESNDATTWTNVPNTAGAASVTATGLYFYNFSAKQVRVRQSVYGGSGTTNVTAELRLDQVFHDYATGAPADAQATDATSSWSVIAMLKGIFTKVALMVFGAGTAAAAQRVTLASDDPAVATLGATSGAKVITDANGTIQQYLRGLVSQWIAGTLVIGAGSNLIGNVGHGKTIKTAPIQAITADTDIVAAVGGKRIKVIAYYIGKTGTNANPILMKSNGAGGTEIGRILLQSQANAVFAANLAVAAPSFLFATAQGEKLTIDVGDTDALNGFITYFDDDAT